MTRDNEVRDLGAAVWLKVSQEDLCGVGKKSGLALEDLFTSKDLETLYIWYRENSDPSQADLDAITGGAVEVAEG